MNAGNAAERTLFSLGWEIEELKHINEEGISLLVEVKVIQDIVRDPESDIIARISQDDLQH